MKLLVTGGCGFIGSNFVRLWRDRYPTDSIEIIDKLTYAGHRENIDNLPVNLVIGDICNSDIVKPLMDGIDVVVNFAAESHVDRSIVDPSVFIRTNVLGTYTLLDAALKNQIKLFHHVSTDEVFGSLGLKSDYKFNEFTPYAPNSPYSASKASADHLVRSFNHTYNLPVTISNCSNNFGPFQDPEKLIPRFITNLILGKKIPLMGKGENVRDWIYVEDHCSAIDLIIHSALKDKKIIGQTFCVGSSEEKSNMEITKIILQYFGRDKSLIEFIPHRLGHDLRYAIDSSKLRKKLRWRPKFPFQKRIKQTIEWYIANQNWWRPLMERDLNRVE